MNDDNQTKTDPAGSPPAAGYAEVANKYDELCEIFSKHKMYAAAQKCQENAEAFRCCKTLVEARRAAGLNEA